MSKKTAKIPDGEVIFMCRYPNLVVVTRGPINDKAMVQEWIRLFGSPENTIEIYGLAAIVQQGKSNALHG